LSASNSGRGEGPLVHACLKQQVEYDDHRLRVKWPSGPTSRHPVDLTNKQIAYDAHRSAIGARIMRWSLRLRYLLRVAPCGARSRVPPAVRFATCLTAKAAQNLSTCARRQLIPSIWHRCRNSSGHCLLPCGPGLPPLLA
jgi:hypothetical protein